MLFNLFKKKEEPKQIQGSGYTSAYAENPYQQTPQQKISSITSLRGAITTPKIQSFNPIQSAQDIKTNLGLNNPGGQVPNKPSPNEIDTNYFKKKEEQSAPKFQLPSYITGYEDLAKQKQDLLGQQKAAKEEIIAKSAAEKNRALQANIPLLQQGLASNKASLQKAIALQQGATAEKKAQREDEWGTTQRQAAMTRRESEARNRNRFAALGTTSSYGAGSYGQAQENVESDFNRFTQEGLKQKQSEIAALDRELQAYEIDAQGKVDNLEIQVTQAINDIISNVNLNDIEKENAIQDIGISYQDALLQVQEGLQGKYQEYYDKLEASGATSLSPEFMQTGVPVTEADYKYMVENYDAYKQMTQGQGTANQGKALTLVNRLLGGNTAAVSGGFRTPGFLSPFVPGAAAARADLEGIKNLLSLAERGQLKGSGAVSDFEARMLEKAALAGLSSELPEDEFIRRLQLLKQDLESGGAVATNETLNRPSLSSFESR